MSNANDVLLYHKKESVYGTLPTGNWATMRIRGHSLKTELATEFADELGNRRVKDVARTDRKVRGDINCRWSYKNADDLFLMALMASEADTWAAVVVQTLTLTAASADNSIVRSAGDWAADGYLAGRWIRVKGLTTNGTEFRCRIASHSSATKIIVDHITLVNEGPTASCEVEQGGYITDASTERSWAFENNYVTPASNFRQWAGCEVDTLRMAVSAKGLAEITAGIVGKVETFSASTAAGTPTAALTDRLINGVDHVRAVFIDGASLAMADWSCDIANNIRERNTFGNLGPTSLGAGQFNATVNLNSYYSGNTQIAKYLAFTDTSLAFEVKDTAGNSYILHWPLGNFTDASGFPTGNNTDIMAPLAFASKEYTLGALTMQMQIARWDV